jgi:hypothetical protein
VSSNLIVIESSMLCRLYVDEMGMVLTSRNHVWTNMFSGYHSRQWCCKSSQTGSSRKSGYLSYESNQAILDGFRLKMVYTTVVT